MSRDLIRLMHAFMMPGAEVCPDVPWHPPCDVYRTPKGWLLKFELAGVRAEDIDLQVLGTTLTLRGVRRDSVLDAARRDGGQSPVHYRMEIAYNQFSRSLELPCDLKKAEIQTEYRDGLLLIHIQPEPKGG